jgi:hypothetical protein
MKKFRRHAVGYVASMMWEATTSYRSFAQVVRDYRAANEREGFTVEYISPGMPPGHWLRIEGVRLTPSEMAEAVAQAKEWLG